MPTWSRIREIFAIRDRGARAVEKKPLLNRSTGDRIAGSGCVGAVRDFATDDDVQTAPRVFFAGRRERLSLQTEGARRPSICPVMLLQTVLVVAMTSALYAFAPAREYLSTRYVHGLGPIPLLIAAALLLLPTPLASVRAGRPLVRVVAECVALAAGLTSTAFLLTDADLQNRDDFRFMVLGAILILTPVIRLGLASAVLRMLIRSQLREAPRASGLLTLCEAFVGCSVPPGLPEAVQRKDPSVNGILTLISASMGTLHRVLHGRPTLPSMRFIQGLRESLYSTAAPLYRYLRKKNSQEVPRKSAEHLAALVAYLEGHTLHRLLHRRAWPAPSKQSRVLSNDMLLADFEQAYILLLQASLHPGADERTKRCPRHAVASLRWVMNALAILPECEYGPVGYLAFALRLGSTEEDVLGIIMNVGQFKRRLREGGVAPSRAEDLAVALVAQRLWERRCYYWALDMLNGIEFTARGLPLARYVRSLIHTSLQEHHDTMGQADRRQIQALAAEDAVWADSPQLYWKEN